MTLSVILIGTVGIAVILRLTKFSSVWFRQGAEAGEMSLTGKAIVAEEAEVAEAEVSYELLEGWNLVAFPFSPLTVKSAALLIEDVRQQGGTVSAVSRWDGDGWQEYVERGTERYGYDFAIEPGKAYFLRSHDYLQWRVVGVPPIKKEVLPIELRSGWQAIGIIQSPLTAGQVLSAINDGEERAVEIDWWRSGSWEVFVQRRYSVENAQEYGTNFTIEPTKGYMVKAMSEGWLRQFE